MGILDNFNPSADSLWAKVDFAGIIEDISGGTVLAIFTAFIGGVLALGRSVRFVIDTLIFSIRSFALVLVSAGTALMRGSVQAATADLSELGLAALPGSIFVIVATIIVVNLIWEVFV